MRMSAGNNQGQQRKVHVGIPFLLFFQQHSVNVAFQVIHGDQRLLQSKRQRFRKADPHQQRPSKPGTLGYGNGVNGFVSLPGLR